MPLVSGVLRYDPRISGPDGEFFDPWWLIVEYDSGLLDRLRAEAEVTHGIRLSYPRWGAHVSVVTGEIPRRKSRWGFRDGETDRFEYISSSDTDGVFYWHRVKCDGLLALRGALGLARNPRGGFHLTLGRVKK